MQYDASAMKALSHDKRLDPALRKAQGVYYTPPTLVDHVVQHTLGPLRDQPRLRILDPACGTGGFLQACQHFLPSSDPLLVGVDLDAKAVRLARKSMQASRRVHPGGVLLRHANALLGPELPAGFDWDCEFPGGFDVVIGNPPWGQKAIEVDDDLKRYLWQRYPSSAGIFDWFRPFVELGIRLLKPGGRFGMVLPDIVLLKDYQGTRRVLLDQLTLERIEWWGKAFTDATIDVATIIGSKKPAPAAHRVRVAVHDPDRPLAHSIAQADFRANPRQVFNLHLTPERRRVLDRLAGCRRLGDCFEIHEGVHSGNMRGELFVERKVDASCRPLLFGRNEIRAFHLDWQGKHIRLAAAPEGRNGNRYANLGRPEWHEQLKVLVRRTGDRVLAAVDREGRYASNNFFLVFPSRDCGLGLEGLCALLNSSFMTWYFRTIEPRQGRAFAELKIKHLRTFPLPGEGWRLLNQLGRRCAQAKEPARLQAEVDALVLELFGIAGKLLR